MRNTSRPGITRTAFTPASGELSGTASILWINAIATDVAAQIQLIDDGKILIFFLPVIVDK